MGTSAATSTANQGGVVEARQHQQGESASLTMPMQLCDGMCSQQQEVLAHSPAVECLDNYCILHRLVAARAGLSCMHSCARVC